MVNRRRFLEMNLGFGASVLTAQKARAAVLDPSESQTHQQAAMRVRMEAAARSLERPPLEQITTGDEERYADKRASFSKTLPHNEIGEVSPEAYRLFVDILRQGNPKRFGEMPRAANAELRLNNPQAAYSYELAGIDSHSTAISWHPPFNSPGMASDMGIFVRRRR